MSTLLTKELNLLQGDCLDVLSAVPSHSIDMAFFDPPYGTTNQSWDKLINFGALWSQLERTVKGNGAIAIFAKPPFDKTLACSNLRLYRYDWVWEKTRATGHLNANRQPLQAHEVICIFYKSQPTYNPQKTHGHKPVNAFYTRKSGSIYRCADKVTAGGGGTDRYPRSVLKYSPVPTHQRLHPNQKPTELLEYLIKTYTNPGEIILDCTMGSGSTGEAALRCDRGFVGIEKDFSMFTAAKSRLLAPRSRF